METIHAGVREAKMHLSRLLRHVKNGNEVNVQADVPDGPLNVTLEAAKLSVSLEPHYDGGHRDFRINAIDVR